MNLPKISTQATSVMAYVDTIDRHGKVERCVAIRMDRGDRELAWAPLSPEAARTLAATLIAKAEEIEPNG